MQSEAMIYDEVFDAQQHFRLILDSMARPGKVNVLAPMDIQAPSGINNASALIALALLNTDASFCAEYDDAVAGFIALHTSAKKAGKDKADLVFIPGLQSSAFIETLKIGTLSYPEDSATIVANVATISTSPINNSLQVTLKGPGVKDTETIYVLGLNPAILTDIKEQNQEFPLGIDLILTDAQNHMICIPRSNDLTFSSVGNSNN